MQQYGNLKINMNLTIQNLAELCLATVHGGNSDVFIESAADIMSANANQVTVLSDAKYAKYLQNSTAAACFIADNVQVIDTPAHIALLRCTDPEISFLTAVKTLYPEQAFEHHIAPQAVVGESVTLGANVHIADFSTVGKNTHIQDNSIIFSGVHIGANVVIGKNCRIYPNVVIYDETQIGDNVTIHSGSVIGADGFGYKFRNNQHIKVLHVGNVVIANNVEIGANTCIDRGVLGSTHIGEGSKIDNLVQIAHNNKVGKNVLICGQSGVSGSCTIEDGAILAGGSALTDHVTIGHHAIVMGRSGVSQDVAPATQVFGVPARDRKVAWRELAALSKLPVLLKKFKLLESRVKKLE
jgi:UDP-3-O-[3-hydroxymyristoyl] glucosamine N-acyltransferase